MPAIVSSIVEVCVFRFRGIKPEYLLLKRSSVDQLYPGIWQIVTGTLQDGETAIDGALRELFEETSLKPDRLWTVPHVNVFYDPQADAVNLVPVFAAQMLPDSVARISGEHENIVWLEREAASRRLVWPGQREVLQIVERYIAGGEQAMGLSEIPL